MQKFIGVLINFRKGFVNCGGMTMWQYDYKLAIIILFPTGPTKQPKKMQLQSHYTG